MMTALKTLKTLCAAAIVGALVGGCASVGTHVSEEQTSKFVKGKTTRVEVIQALGPPNFQTKMSNGTTEIRYSYGEASARPSMYIPFIGPLVGSTETHGTQVTLRFDTKDRLLDIESMESVTESRGGLASGDGKK